jgi:hypothetical protein
VSKPIIDAPDMPPIAAWDSPEDLNRPDASFNDDHVGGRLKAEEAAKKRAVADRFLQQQPRRITNEAIKISEAGAFRPTHEDEAQQRARREAGRRERPGTKSRGTARSRPISAQEEDVMRLEERVENLLAAMEAIGQEEQQTSHDGSASAHGETEAHLDPHQARAARLLKLEREAKFQLQHLLAGGVGMTFMADPRLTFRRLFTRITAWPQGVRPGHKPQSDADIDAFLAWVFEPDGGYVGIEPF